MKVVITLQLDSYDYNTITHLVMDKIITVDEALTAKCISSLSDVEILGWKRMVMRELKVG